MFGVRTPAYLGGVSKRGRKEEREGLEHEAISRHSDLVTEGGRSRVERPSGARAISTKARRESGDYHWPCHYLVGQAADVSRIRKASNRKSEPLT